MRFEIYALLTALSWAAGSIIEKQGVKIGNFSPIMGTAIRTFVSLIILIAYLAIIPIFADSLWPQLKAAPAKSFLYIAIGGGLLSGTLGIYFLYTAMAKGNVSTVLVIAFCFAPVLGAIISYLFLNEKINAIQLSGMAMCIVGAALTVYFKSPPSSSTNQNPNHQIQNINNTSEPNQSQ